MSHKRYTAVLEHFQPRDGSATAALPAEVAELLVQRMIAERISQKVIRMLPPDSVFLAAKPACDLLLTRYIPARLPPAEIEGTYFQPPEVTFTVTSTIPRLHLLPRNRPVYGDNQLRISL